MAVESQTSVRPCTVCIPYREPEATKKKKVSNKNKQEKKRIKGNFFLDFFLSVTTKRAVGQSQKKKCRTEALHIKYSRNTHTEASIHSYHITLFEA